MRRDAHFCFWAILASLLCWNAHIWAQSTARFELSNPVVTTTSASMDVFLTLSGDPADLVDAVAISVFDSSLTSANTDFSRFLFAPDPVTLSNWDPFGDGLNVEGVSTFLVFDAEAVPLEPSATPHRLGALSVDLTGLAPGLSQIIRLSGGNIQLATNTDAAGTVESQFIPSFALDQGPNDIAMVEFGDNATFNTIPEPATALIIVLGTLVL